MKVKLKKLNSKARLPEQAREGDFAYDVWAVSEEEIHPNVWSYRIGFKYEIDREDMQLEFDDFFTPSRVRKPNYFLNECNVCVELRPRSSISDTGMVLANSPGTLDEFFRGEPRAVFYHVFPQMERYHVGEKIGQICISLSLKARFVWDDDINENTARGDGGFGSTGKQ